MSIEFSIEEKLQRSADVIGRYIDLRMLKPNNEDATIEWGSLWSPCVTADAWMDHALDRRPNRSSLSPTDREYAMRLFGKFCVARNVWDPEWSKLSVTLDLDGASGSKPWESLTELSRAPCVATLVCEKKPPSPCARWRRSLAIDRAEWAEP